MGDFEEVCRIVERQPNDSRPYHVFVSGSNNGEWIRIKWNDSVPKWRKEKESLLYTISDWE